MLCLFSDYQQKKTLKLANSGRYFINIQIENKLKNLLERVTVASRLHNSNTKTDDNMRNIRYTHIIYILYKICIAKVIAPRM